MVLTLVRLSKRLKPPLSNFESFPLLTCPAKDCRREAFCTRRAFANGSPASSSSSPPPPPPPPPPTPRNKLLISTCQDVYRNSALEDWLYNNEDFSEQGQLNCSFFELLNCSLPYTRGSVGETGVNLDAGHEPGEKQRQTISPGLNPASRSVPHFTG